MSTRRRDLTPAERDALAAAAQGAARLADEALTRIEELEVAKAKLEAQLVDAYEDLHRAEEAQHSLVTGRNGRAHVPTRAIDQVNQDIALATGVGPAEISRRLALATAPRRHHVARRLLREGRISLYRACTIVHETRHLPDDVIADLETELTAAPRGGGIRSQAGFVRMLRMRVATLDPRGSGHRRAQAKAGRTAYGRVGEDGMATMTVTSTAERIVAILDRADAMARAARATGDPRTLEQLRSDFITDLLLHGHFEAAPGTAKPAAAPTWTTTPTTTRDETSAATKWAPEPESSEHPSDPTHEQPPTRTSEHSPDQSSDEHPASGSGTTSDPPGAANGRPPDNPGRGGSSAPPGPSGCDLSGSWIGRPPAANVWVIVPFEVMAGLSDAACEIPGHGWVTAAQARDLMTAPGSVWSTLPVDIDTGRALTSPTNAYTPTPAMVAHVRALDGVCRFPGCEVPAIRCDIDHRVPWPRGATDVDNLGPLHRGHHNPKTAGLVTVEETPDHAQTGGLRWTTMAGRTYLTFPKDYREALRCETDPAAHPAATVIAAADDPPPF